MQQSNVNHQCGGICHWRMAAIVAFLFPAVALLPQPALAQEPNPLLPHNLSPWSMFLNADIVVKAVMVGLAFASLVTWTVWLAKTIELQAAKNLARRRLAMLELGSNLSDAARACEQRRVFQFVGAHPEAIGFEPFGAREHCGAVNAQPIGRIVLREFALGPVDTHSMKHPEIGAEVGFVGIQERAVPVEEDCACGERCDFHGVGIVSDLSDCEK